MGKPGLVHLAVIGIDATANYSTAFGKWELGHPRPEDY